MKQEEDPSGRLLDHIYDGIQEYDNPLPRWWVALFWITIFFSPLYVLYYHAGPGLLDIDAYNKDMVAFYDLQAQQLLAMGPIDENMLAGLTQESAMMAGAAQVFQVRCSSCHGQLGEGSIGPNLTDDYWIHGGQLVEILQVVTDGVPAKGMVAWKAQLSPAELLSVSAYVGTLRGTDPPRAKAPQGDLRPYAPPSAEPVPATDSGP